MQELFSFGDEITMALDFLASHPNLGNFVEIMESFGFRGQMNENNSQASEMTIVEFNE